MFSAERELYLPFYFSSGYKTKIQQKIGIEIKMQIYTLTVAISSEIKTQGNVKTLAVRFFN